MCGMPAMAGPVPRCQLALALLLAEAAGPRLASPPQLYDPAFTEVGTPAGAAVNEPQDFPQNSFVTCCQEVSHFVQFHHC